LPICSVLLIAAIRPEVMVALAVELQSVKIFEGCIFFKDILLNKISGSYNK
jgi:hypothetical protein